MRLKIEMSLGNAAFADDAPAEIRMVLADFCRKLDAGHVRDGETIRLQDHNGQKVGEAKFVKN